MSLGVSLRVSLRLEGLEPDASTRSRGPCVAADTQVHVRHRDPMRHKVGCGRLTFSFQDILLAAITSLSQASCLKSDLHSPISAHLPRDRLSHIT